jgi:putative Ca2+/H+ antiporter (TMEM165/GDT1 family)
VLIGSKLAGRLPVRAIRISAAIVFAALGAITLSGMRL